MNKGFSTLIFGIGLAVSIALTGACGGSGSGPVGGDPPSSEPPPEVPNAELITPSAGGLLVSEDGAARVLVPPGAVADTVTITVRELDPGTIPQAFAGHGPVGRSWQFGPDGFRFLRPVEVTLAIDPAELGPGFDQFPLSLFTIGLGGGLEPLEDVRFIADIGPAGSRRLGLAAAGLRGLIRHFSPFSKALVALSVFQGDGTVGDFGTFQFAPDVFQVGDGGAANPGGLAYEVTVTNQGSVTATGVQVEDRIAQATGAIRLREILFVSQGSVLGISEDGFTWVLGTLAPGEGATIRFRAEAVDDGVDVNQVALTADQSLGTVITQEPTTIAGPATPAIALGFNHEDGFLDTGDVFQPSKEIFLVGESGDEVAYEIQISNTSAVSATGVVVTEEITPTRRILDFDAIVLVTQGEVVQTGPGGFTWNVGELPPATGATLRFSATASGKGSTSAGRPFRHWAWYRFETRSRSSSRADHRPAVTGAPAGRGRSPAGWTPPPAPPRAG